MEWARRFPCPARAEHGMPRLRSGSCLELDDFTPSEAVDRFRGLGVGTQK